MTDLKSGCEYHDVLLYLHASGTSFSTNVYIEEPAPLRKEGKYPRQSDVIDRTNSGYVGSIFSSLNGPLFVSAYKDNIADLGDFAKTGSDYLFIVSRKFKEIVLKCGSEKSEFAPICVCLTPTGESYPNVGGGNIVEDAYWLWHDYNWMNLIDDRNSEWQRESASVPRSVKRGDLAGSPMQSILNWGPAGQIPRRKLCLRDIDYDANPFFRIVGISGGPFISPKALHALEEENFLNAQNGVRIQSMMIDTLTHFARKPLQDQDILRLHQSDLIVPDGPTPFEK